MESLSGNYPYDSRNEGFEHGYYWAVSLSESCFIFCHGFVFCLCFIVQYNATPNQLSTRPIMMCLLSICEIYGHEDPW